MVHHQSLTNVSPKHSPSCLHKIRVSVGIYEPTIIFVQCNLWYNCAWCYGGSNLAVLLCNFYLFENHENSRIMTKLEEQNSLTYARLTWLFLGGEFRSSLKLLRGPDEKYSITSIPKSSNQSVVHRSVEQQRCRAWSSHLDSMDLKGFQTVGHRKHVIYAYLGNFTHDADSSVFCLLFVLLVNKTQLFHCYQFK